MSPSFVPGLVITTLLLTATTLTACGPLDESLLDASAAADAARVEPDAALSDPDGGTVDAQPAACEAPDQSTACVRVGCTIRGFTLPSCAPDHTQVRMYDDDFCRYAATLILMHTPWCAPSVREAVAVQAEITSRLGSIVRVITVLAQDMDGSTPTESTC